MGDKMKKLKLTIMSSILLTTSLLTIKSNAQDNTYQTYTKPIPKTYNLQELPKEVQEDIQSIQNMKYLKLKTSSDYEIAISNDDGTYSYVQSEDNLNSAIDIANNLKNTKNQGIPVVINKEGIVIYATEGIGRVVKIIDGNVDTTNNYTTNVYKTSELKSPEHTYINHGYIDDVPIIEDNGQVVKIEVSGYTGYIKKQEDDGSLNIITVPMNQVNNLSHYTVNSNNELVHAISSDITSTPKYSYQTLGPAPSFMNQNTKYYSYDGNYFYTDINQLISDAKLDNHNNAINSNNPYYNYYQYLPGRSNRNP